MYACADLLSHVGASSLTVGVDEVDEVKLQLGGVLNQTGGLPSQFPFGRHVNVVLFPSYPGQLAYVAVEPGVSPV